MEYYDSDDQLVEIEETDECNTCGRTEYMCPGH
jgi:DNA-directed RNA polymerase beta' subunit